MVENGIKEPEETVEERARKIWENNVGKRCVINEAIPFPVPESKSEIVYWGKRPPKESE